MSRVSFYTDRGPAEAAPFVADIRDDAVVGGKARSLARLAQAGLPVPRGFVVTDALFRALVGDGDGRDEAAVAAMRTAILTAEFPPGFEHALAEALAALGAQRLAVRSSFAHEDAAAEVAAGVYESRIGVAPADVAGAVREVLASAIAPAAVAYAHAHGRAAGEAPVAVLVHAYVAGDAHGHAAAWDAEVLLDVDAGSLAAGARVQLAESVGALAAARGAVETEWVANGNDVTYLQLRPFAPPVPQPPWRGFAELPPGDDARAWTWDAAHNPLPLSAAHAGLVAWVDARCRIGIRQRVLGGYLFWARDPRGPVGGIRADALASELAALVERTEARLQSHARQAPALASALAMFTEGYEALLGAIQPAARHAREALRAFLRTHFAGHAGANGDVDALLVPLLAHVESRATERRRLAEALAHAHGHDALAAARAAYIEAFGDEAPAWDVASPTHRERPERLSPSAPPSGGEGRGEGAAASAAHPTATLDQLAAALPPHLAAELRAHVAHARAAVACGEDDDWFYARLQAPVRAAILQLGQSLVARGALAHIDDAFHLSLTTLLAVEAGSPPPASELRAAVDRAKEAHARALHDPPPPPASAATSATHVRGTGCGGRVTGRVVLHPAATPPPRDAVLVARTLLPTELPLLDVAALVTETGGPLGHVAIQARERGLSAVVGARGALTRLRAGDLVLVDGAAGLVIRLEPER